VEQHFLKIGSSLCHPAINVKVLKGTQRTNPNQWPGLVFLHCCRYILTLTSGLASSFFIVVVTFLP